MYEISLDTITEPPSSLFSHEILLMLICWLYPMIATTGDARVYCATKICFYMFTMRRFSRQTHTFGWKFYHALCSGSIALRIYHCRNFYPSAMLCTSSIELCRAGRRKIIVWWLKNTRPAMAPPFVHSFVRLLAVHPWCALQYKHTFMLLLWSHNIFYVPILFSVW